VDLFIIVTNSAKSIQQHIILLDESGLMLTISVTAQRLAERSFKEEVACWA
jgi:hypothetical protein